MKAIKIIFSIIITIGLSGYFACSTPSAIAEPDPDPDPMDTIVPPVDYTLRGQILLLPENYSLLKDILKQSGWEEALADTTQTYTFFVQDNADFAAAGIHSAGELLATLRAAAAPEAEGDSVLLARFIAYRTLPGVIETDSLFKMPFLEPLVDGEKIFLSLDYSDPQSGLKLNDLNGHLTAPDATLDSDSEYSNRHCSNGIIHKISGNLWVKDRKPYRIYWDIAEQPEIMALPVFRNPPDNGYVSEFFKVGELSEITWEAHPRANTMYSQVYYCYNTMPQYIDDYYLRNYQHVYGDYLRFQLHSLCIQWIEFKTPVLIGSPEGAEYTLWLCYRRELELEPRFIFRQEGYEDQILSEVFNLADYMPAADKLPVDGYKQYNAKRHEIVICSHILGAIKVYNTGRHILRIEPRRDLRISQMGSWDMIQFIPSAEDQYFPRIDMLGNWIGADVEVCKIFPYEECD